MKRCSRVLLNSMRKHLQCGWFAKVGILLENVGFDLFSMDVFHCIYTTKSMTVREKDGVGKDFLFSLPSRQIEKSQPFPSLLVFNLRWNSRKCRFYCSLPRDIEIYTGYSHWSVRNRVIYKSIDRFRFIAMLTFCRFLSTFNFYEKYFPLLSGYRRANFRRKTESAAVFATVVSTGTCVPQ